MIGKGTKDDAVQAMESIKEQHSSAPWFKSAGLDTDEGGWHVDVRVTAVNEMEASGAGPSVRHWPVKICLISMGSGSVKPAKDRGAALA